MLSPTLALRCPQCQHALALTDIRTAPTCPQCGAAHGLPSAVADSLALYERAIQQTVVDLLAAAPADGHPTVGAPAPSDSPTVGAPAPSASPAAGPPAGPPAPSASAPPDPPAPSASATAGPPAPSASRAPAAANPLAALLAAPRPAPATSAPAPAASASAAARIAAPVPSVSFSALAADPAGVSGSGAAASLPPSAISTLRGPAEPEGPPASLPPTPLAAARGDTLPEVRLANAVAASNSSLLSVLSDRSSTALSDTPLLVAAVREHAQADTQPVPSASPASRIVDAVRQILPDRPDAEPEREGRIPAAALAVARRALLVRYADERRSQQVRESSLALFFAAVVCALLVVVGLWYVAAPIAVVALALRLRREERGERFGAEVQRLADALGGARLPSYDAIAAWFDGLWPAPVSPEAMWTSHLHGAVRCQVRGYEALLDVHLNEKTSAGTVYPPRITAYLAAVWPGRVPSLRATAADLPASAQARLVRLRRAGYAVVADPHGGLIMRVSEAIAQAARTDITRLPALQVPIHELADLARELGGEPVAAP